MVVESVNSRNLCSWIICEWWINLFASVPIHVDCWVVVAIVILVTCGGILRFTTTIVWHHSAFQERHFILFCDHIGMQSTSYVDENSILFTNFSFGLSDFVGWWVRLSSPNRAGISGSWRLSGKNFLGAKFVWVFLKNMIEIYSFDCRQDKNTKNEIIKAFPK